MKPFQQQSIVNWNSYLINFAITHEYVKIECKLFDFGYVLLSCICIVYLYCINNENMDIRNGWCKVMSISVFRVTKKKYDNVNCQFV